MRYHIKPNILNDIDFKTWPSASAILRLIVCDLEIILSWASDNPPTPNVIG